MKGADTEEILAMGYGLTLYISILHRNEAIAEILTPEGEVILFPTFLEGC